MQNTKKRDCPATIVIKQVKVYNEYEICTPTDKCNKSYILHQLERNIESATSLTRYVVEMPLPTVHNHDFSLAEGMAQPVDERIITKIEQLTRNGITNVYELRNLIGKFVESDIMPNMGTKPSDRDRRYKPTIPDIKNAVNRTMAKDRYSQLDQENLIHYMQECKKKDPDILFELRTHTSHEPDMNILLQTNVYTEDGIDEDEGNNVITDSSSAHENLATTVAQNCPKTFLFVHQNRKQQELLSVYGNELCLLDATYKTTKYALPLFQLAIKTNVDYQVVAKFIIERETTACIAEALSVIKEWNPLWHPKCFMTDYCEAEIGATRQVFPAAANHICDFHRLQAWNRWLRKTDNGVLSHDRDNLMHLMNKVASAKPNAIQDTIKDLKSTTVWNSNTKLQR